MEISNTIIESIARVAHEANRSYCQSIGDDSQVAWADAPEWQKNSAVEGVRHVLNGNTPEQLHELWCKSKEEQGWTYGDTKDPVAKTHPCMVPYHRLPQNQKVKDQLFRAIVVCMIEGISCTMIRKPMTDRERADRWRKK